MEFPTRYLQLPDEEVLKALWDESFEGYFWPEKFVEIVSRVRGLALKAFAGIKMEEKVVHKLIDEFLVTLTEFSKAKKQFFPFPILLGERMRDIFLKQAILCYKD